MCEWGQTKVVRVPVLRNDCEPTGFEWAEREIDSCIADLIIEFNANRQYTKVCCCGHGKSENSSVLFWDDDEMKTTINPARGKEEDD